MLKEKQLQNNIIGVRRGRITGWEYPSKENNLRLGWNEKGRQFRLCRKYKKPTDNSLELVREGVE